MNSISLPSQNSSKYTGYSVCASETKAEFPGHRTFLIWVFQSLVCQQICQSSYGPSCVGQVSINPNPCVPKVNVTVWTQFQQNNSCLMSCTLYKTRGSQNCLQKHKVLHRSGFLNFLWKYTGLMFFITLKLSEKTRLMIAAISGHVF